VLNVFAQILTVILPMMLVGAYNMFCWLLAEPIVMPIWNNLIKPAYDWLLRGIHNFGIGCVRRWREFWSSAPAPQTPTSPRTSQKPKTFRQRIYPLLFKKKPTSNISSFSSKNITVSSPTLAKVRPAPQQGV